MAARIIRRVGVETGGSNIQFAVNPRDGRVMVIEMNPRVSRSSALASKATGFPIAKIAAKLAVGYTLDEIPNDITRETPASFEPTIDYVVVKVPRWTFEKFPGADPTLGTQMKSVGETMAIGRTFQEALQKGLRSLEIDRYGLGGDGHDKIVPERLRERLITPHPERIFYIRYAFQAGMSVEQVAALTQIDPWFLAEVEELVEPGRAAAGLFAGDAAKGTTVAGQAGWVLGRATGTSAGREAVGRGWLRSSGSGCCAGGLAGHDSGGQGGWVHPGKTPVHPGGSLPDGVLAELLVRQRRKQLGIRAVYNLVDTCAAEFEAYTPYLYSTYETTCEANPANGRR